MLDEVADGFVDNLVQGGGARSARRTIQVSETFVKSLLSLVVGEGDQGCQVPVCVQSKVWTLIKLLVQEPTNRGLFRRFFSAATFTQLLSSSECAWITLDVLATAALLGPSSKPNEALESGERTKKTRNWSASILNGKLFGDCIKTETLEGFWDSFGVGTAESYAELHVQILQSLAAGSISHPQPFETVAGFAWNGRLWPVLTVTGARKPEAGLLLINRDTISSVVNSVETDEEGRGSSWELGVGLSDWRALSK